MYCPHCKTPIQEGDIVCLNCNKKIDGPGRVIYPTQSRLIKDLHKIFHV